MKIMLLVSSMGSGGAERVASTLVNAWAKRGHSVDLVATFSGRGSCFYTLADEVRLVFLADHVKSETGGRGGYLARFGALRRLIGQRRPDVVISFLTNVNVAAIVACAGLRVPVVVCEHNNPAVDGRSAFWRLATRLIYPFADAATVLTESAVTPFRRMVPGVRQLFVLPNLLPDEIFAVRKPDALAAQMEGVANTATDNARKRLVAVGRLHEQKQFNVLIEAFAALAGSFKEWDLWIWGDGPERARLEALVSSLNMSDRIFMPGKTASPWTEMISSDAFALPSKFEGLPMALMEAMALGVASIAFDCPSGPREITRDGRDGMLIPPNDVQSFREGLSRLLADDGLRERLGQSAARSIKERYSIERVLDHWNEILLSIGVAPSGVPGGKSDAVREYV
ncbi:glycosyltransferase family 4 protein [Paraburkholderia sp. LEh10]|uniref:glycosyltransferase family 4 protein n=1 Tax=Paraburkholderia sp. LEh10 TaxID=2821353 RepID=UPI001AE5D62E|nr:glycosyltransferase family 4 protein [Paraburkholderia sp. LEh10]MBP0590964.1 glycosyltransferase family 4 protein [Paraburkholderia sp. LEh10]